MNLIAAEIVDPAAVGTTTVTIPNVAVVAYLAVIGCAVAARARAFREYDSLTVERGVGNGDNQSLPVTVGADAARDDRLDSVVDETI
jgi:hypothetical protein